MLSKKLQRWVQNDLISEEQSQKIAQFEKSHNGGIFLKISFALAGLLIGLGICLVVGANWDKLPITLRLFGVFAVFAGFIYGLCRTYQLDKPKLREFFLVVCFLMIGATIGIVGQTFNLDGGWENFAIGWSVLAIPYVFCSRSRILNGVWLILFLSGLQWELFFENLVLWFPWLPLIKWEYYIVPVLITSVLVCCGISWLAAKADEKIHRYTVMAETIALLMMFCAYYTLFWCSIGSFEYFYRTKIDLWIMRCFVFAFLICRMWLAVRKQNMISFRRNAFLLELYIFVLFMVQFGDMLTSGIGFIICGLLILLFIKVLRHTSRYIKNMEIFNE